MELYLSKSVLFQLAFESFFETEFAPDCYDKKAGFAFDTTSQKYEKNIEFSEFPDENVKFYLGQLDVFKFWVPSGTLDDHIHFEQQNKTSKNLEFLLLFFGCWVCG